MIKIILSVLLLSPASFADDLLDVLDGSGQQSDGLSIEKKSSIFKSLVSRPNPEQTIFFQFLEKGQYNKALYQWPSAFEGKAFATTDNGKALYGYLLFKNGLELTGLETLFQARSQRVSAKLISLWRGNMQTREELWRLTDVKWKSGWSKIFGVPAEVTVVARRFDSELTTSQIEDLLRRTTSKTWERSWTEWRFVTSLLLNGEDIKAAKLLKHLQSIKENNPVSQNLMNLTAARMLYQNGYLDEAIRYYGKVEKGSDYWFEALEEMAWSELRLGRPQNALAHSQTLLAPVWTSDIGPETFYMTSLAQLKVCDYSSVSKVLKNFRERFQAKAAALLDLKKQPDNVDTKKLFAKINEGRVSMSVLGTSGLRLPRYSTRDENLFYLVKRQNKLAAESSAAQKLYSQSLSEGTALVGFQAQMERFKKSASQRSRNSFVASLNRVKALADEELNEIAGVLKKMQIVEAELIQQLAMADQVIKDSKGQKTSMKKGTTGSSANETLRFPYTGEIWFDELSHYKIDVAKGCQVGGKEASL